MRRKLMYCNIVLATSMVWFMLDLGLIMYYSDCGKEVKCNEGDDHAQPREVAAEHVKEPESPQLFRPRPPPAAKLKNNPPDWPGEQGKAVVIPESKQAEMKELFKLNQFNLMASDMISLNRSLPDVRLEGCKSKKYPPPVELPPTSVIIVFHNEAWSTLLRSVHSIINRSPAGLVEEVILVDDASERDFLGEKLDNYVKTLPIPVHVERMGERSGLIRARLRGAAVATGKVLTFLDAHIECTEGWLEPLLTRIKDDRKNVVCPIIDVISDDNFAFHTGSDMTYGGFNWKLQFRWYPVPKRETERRGGDRTQPLKTPTMAGGLFSIDKSYFEELGTYDAGMDVWGGENIEISFRIWMCGGTLEIVTCSHVGHVFRKSTPYTFPGGTGRIINRNNQRVAEVWMDDYKKFYYKINPGVRNTEYGDVTQRQEMRKSLQCQSFEWYLENVYPESQFRLAFQNIGEIRNIATRKCLDNMGRKEHEKLGFYTCHGQGGNQIFALTKNNEMQHDDLCLDAAPRGANAEITMYKCHGKRGNQEWIFKKEDKTIIHAPSGFCLDVPPQGKDAPIVTRCSGHSSQQWELVEKDMH